MKIECVKEKFQIAVAKAEKITGKNPTLPILSCILFETKNNNLVIKTTNLDLGFELSVPVKVIEPGSVAVPATIISNFLNTTTNNKNIVLETKENVLNIKTENNNVNIKTLSPDDFPTIPTIHDGKTSKIQSKDLTNGIKSVVYSASVSSVKPELASVYLYSNEDQLVFVSTDSFRLAEKTIKMKKPALVPGILIPFKNAADIVKIIDTVDEEITLTAAKNQISFSFSGAYLVSRAIDGVFPDYKQIVPKEEKTKVTLLKQDLANSLKTSGIFSDSFSQINVAAESGAKSILLKTRNANVGESTVTVDATVDGESIAINFNERYIADCLPSIASDSVNLFFNGANRALVIRGTSDKSFMYLVMPMNR